MSIWSITHKSLPGRVSVRAPYPNVFLQVVPLSHRSCIRGWSLIPPEDLIWQAPSKEPTPPVPGWYSMLKCRIYKGDIGYALSFDKDANELSVLIALQWLRPRSHPSDALGQDPNACHLFSPELHHGQLHSPYRGLTRYQHSTDIFISGLLLMKLRPNQFKYLPTPFPSQICLHVASMVDPCFMKATHAKFNRHFWKPDDCAAISDPYHGEKWGNFVSIDLENKLAVVRLPEGPEYEFPLSSLGHLYHVGDVIRIIADPYSDSRYVHHQNLGCSGFICDVDPLSDDITISDSPNSEV